MRTKAAVLLAATAFFAGCAGRDFIRPSTESLVLGKTTYQQVRQMFGDPYREGTALVNDQSIKMISYAYATAYGSPRVSGVTPARAMAFSFLGDTLVGHEFTSSYDEDATDFDESKVREIKKGETSRQRVVELLGASQGVYAFPLVRNENEEGIVYLYSQTKRKPFSVSIYRKHLVVSYDRQSGVVTDVRFSSSGEK